MYTNDHVDPDNPPKATRHLNRKILCGLCNFRCCNSKSLQVECTPEESERLDLPEKFPIDGGCRCLTDTGCVHGEGRPVLCRFYPLQVKPDNSLVISHWATLNCPSSKDYEFVKRDADGYHYRCKEVAPAKRSNCRETLVLDQPLEDMPTSLDDCKEAFVELYDEKTYDKIKQELARLNGEGGFGLT